MSNNPSMNPSSAPSSSHGSSPNGSNELDPQLIWTTVRKCWTWALPIGLAFASVAAFAVYATFVPMYQATHLLESNQQYIAFKGAIPQSRDLLKSERRLISTDLVLDQVVADQDVQNALQFESQDSGKVAIRRNMSIGNAGVKSMLTIAFKHSDPNVAATVANKITAVYLTQRDRLDEERVSDLEGWLAPSIDYWKNEVATHSKRVRDMSQKTMGFDPSQRVEGLEYDLSVLGNLRSRISELVVEEELLKARIKSHDANPPVRSTAPIIIPEPTTAEINEFVESSGQVQLNKGLLADRESRMRGMDDNGTKNLNKDYFQKLSDQAEEYRTKIEEARAEAKSRAVDTIKRDRREIAERNREAGFQQVIASRENERVQLSTLEQKIAVIRQEYDIERARLQQNGGFQADLVFAQEERELGFSILSELNHRVATIQTERRRGSGVQSLAEATPPITPMEPASVKKMFVFGAGAFALPFLIGGLLEFRKNRVCSAASLEKSPVAPVLGEVAVLPAKAGNGRRQRMFEESIDSLRANLMLSKGTRGVRTVTVASSMSGEGKSSVSSQLAISLAKACGKTVLLIDADLRSPDQHDIFGLEMGPGLTQVMTGAAKLDDAVDRSLGDLVHVLPAGRMTTSPHRLLNSSGLRGLLDEALERYSYVVVDTAPVLAAGETLAVASETDATLVCVMRDVSRTDNLVRSTRRLEAAGANVVGTVFSGVPSTQYAYRYGDYRYLTSAQEA